MVEHLDSPVKSSLEVSLGQTPLTCQLTPWSCGFGPVKSVRGREREEESLGRERGECSQSVGRREEASDPGRGPPHVVWGGWRATQVLTLTSDGHHWWVGQGTARLGDPFSLPPSLPSSSSLPTSLFLPYPSQPPNTQPVMNIG